MTLVSIANLQCRGQKRESLNDLRRRAIRELASVARILRTHLAMFQRILVPTDLTERAIKALDVALKLGGTDRPRVTLLHVIETFHGLDFEEMRPAYQRFERKASGIMAAAVERLPHAGTAVDQEIVYGERAEAIVEFATTHDIDLIVIASHRVNPSAVGRDWGTISYKVGLLAQCPVLLVK